MDNRKLPTREDADNQYKWAIEDLYADDAQWEKDFELLEAEVEKLGRFKDHVGDSADSLLETLRADDSISKIAEKVYVYANQRLHENTGNSKYQDYSGKAQNVMVRLSAATSYVTPEILDIPDAVLAEYLESENGIKEYTQFLANIVRQKSHILSHEMEKLLADMGEVAEGPKNIFSMFNNADLKFGEITDEEGKAVELTHGRYVGFLESRNRDVRREAFKAMYKAYGAFRNTLGASFSANVKQQVFFAKTRKYPSSLAAALDGSNVPVEVYDNLIETVHGGLDLMHRYVALRKKLLGVDELHMYDLYVPMVEDVTMKIPFEEAKKIVREGLEPLGQDYQELLECGFNGGWIDVYENQGKRSGAYSWGAYGTHPYVLLNYQDNLNNVFTLAHEMGHALHSYYSDEAQPYIYAGYRIFVAEVASTCNESLLIHHLIEKTEDRKQKAYLINYFLEQFRGTLFRQTMFAEFEKTAHAMVEEGKVLTAESLCEVYYGLNKKYFGEAITADEEIALEWARIPHFYTPFYVYQYATGFSAAIALSQRILKEGGIAVEDYRKFLKGGSSDYPIELLKMAGVDMTEKTPVESALKVFEKYLDKLEELLK